MVGGGEDDEAARRRESVALDVTCIGALLGPSLRNALASNTGTGGLVQRDGRSGSAFDTSSAEGQRRTEDCSSSESRAERKGGRERGRFARVGASVGACGVRTGSPLRSRGGCCLGGPQRAARRVGRLGGGARRPSSAAPHRPARAGGHRHGDALWWVVILLRLLDGFLPLVSPSRCRSGSSSYIVSCYNDEHALRLQGPTMTSPAWIPSSSVSEILRSRVSEVVCSIRDKRSRS